MQDNAANPVHSSEYLQLDFRLTTLPSILISSLLLLQSTLLFNKQEALLNLQSVAYSVGVAEVIT